MGFCQSPTDCPRRQRGRSGQRRKRRQRRQRRQRRFSLGGSIKSTVIIPNLPYLVKQNDEVG